MKRYNFDVLLRMAQYLISCSLLMGSISQAYKYLRSKEPQHLGTFKKRGIPFSGRKVDWNAIYEVLAKDEYSCIQHLFPQASSPRVLDIGANIGSFAIRTFIEYPTAHVVSVEAAEDTFDILQHNKKSNSRFNWKPLLGGVWGKDAQLTLTRKNISAGHRVTEMTGENPVQSITLKNLALQLNWESIDLIKIDIEGGEESVIPNSLEVLSKTRFLIIEIHSDRIDPQPVMSALTTAFKYHWQLNQRISKKPLFLMSNENFPFESL